MRTFRQRSHLLFFRGAIRYAAFRGDLLARLIVRTGNQNPYPIYEQVRARGPVARTSLGPVYLSASHGFVSQALRSPELSVVDSEPPATGPLRPVQDSFLMRNRPDHPRLRRLVTPWFTAKALQQRREALSGIAHQRLDELAGQKSFDVVQDYFVPVAVRVICELTGLPLKDWRRLAALGDILPLSTTNRIPSERQERLLQTRLIDLDAYLDETVRSGTAPEGSLVAALTDRATDPNALNRNDLIATLGVLLIAGFETSVGLMGHLTTRFVEHPDLRRAALGDREVFLGTLEETLRFEPPVQFTVRRIDQECEVDGVRLKSGREVMLLLAGASRDPEVFPEPAEFRPDRPNSKAHLAFSGGEHYCIGANLARLESEVSVQALFERHPELRRAGRPRWQPSQNIRAFRSIPVSP